MSMLMPKYESIDKNDTLQRLLNAKNELNNAETQLEDQLSNPKNGSYGSSVEQGTLEAFYYLASAKSEYNDVLEEFYETFEYR